MASPLLSKVRRAPPQSVHLVLDASGHPARLGHGGTRGSCVYLVEVLGIRRALKMCAIGHGELAFCVAMQNALAVEPTTVGPHGELPADAPEGFASVALPLFLADRTAFATPNALGAVAPAAMLRLMAESNDPDDVLVGVVMPLFDCSLHRLLNAPSVDVACRPRDTPVTPGSPAPGWAMRHPESVESMHSMEEHSTSSDDGADGAPLPFHAVPRQRAIRSIVVIVAILERVVAGLAAVRDALPHDVCPACQARKPADTADSSSVAKTRGFAHQDIRADNVLLSRSGRVVLCDFELVAHVTEDGGTLVQPAATPTFEALAGSSASTANSLASNGRRLLPMAFHAPEGPNRPGGDAWLVGLLGLELFTGVTPIVKSAVAFDDFGAGPLLTVDPDNGIGWDSLRAHVHSRIRPFPSSEEVTTGAAAGYMDPAVAGYCADAGEDPFAMLHRLSAEFEAFLARCLANDPAKRASLPELARAPVFETLRKLTHNRPQSTIRAWVNVVGSSNSSSPMRPPAEEGADVALRTSG